MKAIGTQMHEAGGSMLPPIAAKSEPGTAEAFQAALAQAMQGAPAAPTFEPRPIGISLPSVVQPPVPMPIPTAGPIPVAISIPGVPTPAPTLDPAPAPAAILKPTAFFERRPLVAPVPVAPFAVAPGISAPTGALSSPPAPTFESRPISPPSPVAICGAPPPVAVCAAPPAIEQPEQIAPGPSEQEPAPVVPPPAGVVQHIAGQVVAPVQIDKAIAPAEPKKKGKTDSESAEQMPAPAASDGNAAQVALPLVDRPSPQPSVPLIIPTGATRQRAPHEAAGPSKTPLDSKSRQATSMPKADGFQPHALDALLPQERVSSQPATPRAAAAEPKPEAPALDHTSMPASVKVEELQVESTVAHPAATRAPVAPATEAKKPDAEPGISAAGGAGAGSGGNVSSHGQRLGYDAPVAADGPVETRHADESPRPPAPTDRVTLHLPDDAGGGRIQIAVRGDVVHARIVSADEAGTRELQAGADELRGALTRQGFQETHVRIEGGRVAADGWQRGAGAGLGAAAAGESAGSGDGRMQDSQQQDRRERHHGAPEDPRSDPRRQHPDGRSQQRARRERER